MRHKVYKFRSAEKEANSTSQTNKAQDSIKTKMSILPITLPKATLDTVCQQFQPHRENFCTLNNHCLNSEVSKAMQLVQHYKTFGTCTQGRMLMVQVWNKEDTSTRYKPVWHPDMDDRLSRRARYPRSKSQRLHLLDELSHSSVSQLLVASI